MGVLCYICLCVSARERPKGADIMHFVFAANIRDARIVAANTEDVDRACQVVRAGAGSTPAKAICDAVAHGMPSTYSTYSLYAADTYTGHVERVTGDEVGMTAGDIRRIARTVAIDRDSYGITPRVASIANARDAVLEARRSQARLDTPIRELTHDQIKWALPRASDGSRALPLGAEVTRFHFHGVTTGRLDVADIRRGLPQTLAAAAAYLQMWGYGYHATIAD